MKTIRLGLFLGLLLALLSTAFGAPSKLVNLSNRHWCGPGQQSMISGISVSPGDGAWVLVRGVGPSLAQFGLTDVLKSPKTAIVDSQGNAVGPILTSWDRNALNGTRVSVESALAGAFALLPGSNDTATVVLLKPGTYTVQMTSADSTSGTGLIEIYQATPIGLANPSRLNNMSSLQVTGPGQNSTISGFSISPGDGLSVLIRGVGPTLGIVGLNDELKYPVMTIRDGAGKPIMPSVTNWDSIPANGSRVRAASLATGAFALNSNSADAAVVLRLDPGTYTIELAGADGGSGFAIIETYEVPESD